MAPDLHLAVREYGRGEPVLLLLHGFTETGRTWDPLVARWRERARCLAVDLIGHGASDAPADPARYTVEGAAADLVALLDAVDVPSAVVVGYSLGGRVALRLALDAPERVHGLVLVSASAGIAEPSERRERYERDLELAERIEHGGIERFVAEWEARDLFAGERGLPRAARDAMHAQRLSQRTRGLANSLRGMGQGAMAPLWGRLGGVRAPTLVVTGARDARYAAIGRRMAAILPGARHVVVPEAGHGVHRERPSEVAMLVEAFLTGERARMATREVRT